MSNIGLLTEYESILVGKRKAFSNAYLNKHVSNAEVAPVFKYVYENLLGWTPQIAYERTSQRLITALHLERPVRRLTIPPEINIQTDLFYISKIVYPNEISCTKKSLVIKVYEKVLNGDLKKFPKNFFSENEGAINADICFQYAIEKFLYIRNVQELYEFFADRSCAMAFLRKSKLIMPFQENFEYPIDMLHNALSVSDQNELFYRKGRFDYEYEAAKKEKGISHAN